MSVPGEDTRSKELLYQNKLDDVLSTKLTAENIDSYANDAINEIHWHNNGESIIRKNLRFAKPAHFSCKIGIK